MSDKLIHENIWQRPDGSVYAVGHDGKIKEMPEGFLMVDDKPWKYIGDGKWVAKQ